MHKGVAILGTIGFFAATAASGQFVDNGGAAGSADTSAFGQASEFSNVTTTFDGIELQILRLIREPSDASKLRLVGQLVSSNSEPRWVQMYDRRPRLVDDLGNTYILMSWSGIDACRSGEIEDFYWWTSLGECAGPQFKTMVVNNDGASALVAQNVPVAFSMIFSPIDPAEGLFDTDLAKLATSVTATLSFAVAVKNFTELEKESSEGLSAHQVVVPRIPVPQQ
ncbi:MAG: hypothetical protein O9274_15940 [Limnobacter sp.]|uniref:hypothetical protein n=1 Tax=Limnobacter sp. TaxID=2003368 RepID=UPI0022BB7F39|nr:hypothetical protein [Limnobacter sp.]MCZ8017194.1 hypothetical protein [Limnobacter sp.]MCZ8081327.1 hypothetical protein [Paracoccaceae bacterium]